MQSNVRNGKGGKVFFRDYEVFKEKILKVAKYQWKDLKAAEETYATQIKKWNFRFQNNRHHSMN